MVCGVYTNPQVTNGAILQQVFVVEFVIQSQMCEDCHRIEAKDFWNSVVQVRQKVLQGSEQAACSPLSPSYPSFTLPPTSFPCTSQSFHLEALFTKTEGEG